MLTLGNKYDVDKLWKEGIHQLKCTYPTDLLQRLEAITGVDCIALDDWLDLISVVNVTKTLGPEVNWFYLNALYDCCQVYTKEILSGLEIDSGVEGIEFDKQKVVLRSEDQVAVLDGRTKLLQVHYKNMGLVFGADDEVGARIKCSRKQDCEALVRHFRFTPVQDRISDTSKYDPLHVHERHTWFRKCCDRLCESCRTYYEAMDLQRRQKVLDELERYF